MSLFSDLTTGCRPSPSVRRGGCSWQVCEQLWERLGAAEVQQLFQPGVSPEQLELQCLRNRRVSCCGTHQCSVHPCTVGCAGLRVTARHALSRGQGGDSIAVWGEFVSRQGPHMRPAVSAWPQSCRV